jgi:hypothetical protein
MTQARVLKIIQGNSITLPKSFVNAIGHPFGLAILVMKDSNVKLYPVNDSNVQYLRLEIEKLSKSFLEDLTSIFEKTGLEDILFTSGICQAANECYYECYFTPQQLNTELPDLENQLNNIVGVKTVILHKVQEGGD